MRNVECKVQNDTSDLVFFSLLKIMHIKLVLTSTKNEYFRRQAPERIFFPICNNNEVCNIPTACDMAVVIPADLLVGDAGGVAQNVLHMTFQQCRHMNQQHTRHFFQLKQWRYVLSLLVWKVWQNARV